MILHFGQLISIFSLKENIEFVTDTYDPSVGGLEAAIGSFYSRSTNGDFFKKTGSADTDWELILSGGDTTGGSVGTGLAAYHSKSGSTLYFRSVAAAPDGNVTITLDGSNETILIKANKYPAAPNVVYVDSSIAANQTGLVYQTIAQAATYVASQIPTADLPWEIVVYSSSDASAFSIGDYVHITSKGPRNCKLTGAFVFTGSVDATNGLDYYSFASSLTGFIILGMDLAGSATGTLIFENCWFPAGKTYSGTPVAANGLKINSGFNGTVITRNCMIGKVSVSVGGGSGDSVKAIYHFNDKFWANTTPASSYSYGSTTAQFFQCELTGITGLSFNTNPASLISSSNFLSCVFKTGGGTFNFAGAANVGAGGSIFDSSGGAFTTTGLTGVLSEWGGGGGGGGTGLTTTAVKTAAYTAASNERVPADTNGGAFPIQLPPTPAHGDEVEVLDVGDFFATNNLTVDRNGNNINGIAANATLNVDNSLTKFVFITSYGWRMV